MKVPSPSWQQAAARDAVMLMIETIPRFYKELVNSINDTPPTVLPPRTHYRLLGILRFRANLSLTELARAMGMAKANVSPLVEKLVQAGLVLRQQDATDRRLWGLSLSESGFAEHEAGMASLQAAFAGCFAAFDPVKGERFGQALSIVQAGFSELSLGSAAKDK